MGAKDINFLHIMQNKILAKNPTIKEKTLHNVIGLFVF